MVTLQETILLLPERAHSQCRKCIFPQSTSAWENTGVSDSFSGVLLFSPRPRAGAEVRLVGNASLSFSYVLSCIARQAADAKCWENRPEAECNAAEGWWDSVAGGDSWGGEWRGRAQHHEGQPSALLSWGVPVILLTHRHLPLDGPRGVVPGMFGYRLVCVVSIPQCCPPHFGDSETHLLDTT